MKKIHRLSLIALVIALMHVSVPVVAAHPLGNFTVNHFAGLTVSREAIAIDYVLDMAEIPAFQEIARLDANHNGQPDGGEFAAYPATKCAGIDSSLNLNLAGKRVALRLTTSTIEFPSGAGGLLTLRLTCAFNAPLPSGAENLSVTFAANADPERLGWREIVLTADGIEVQGDFSTSSPSQRLTAYPNDLLNSPLNQREVSFVIAPVAGDNAWVLPNSDTVTASVVERGDAFTRLITLQELTLPTILLAIGIAFVWGGLHAMTPGHGKTVVAAYLVGSRGTATHALYLGLTTTLTHTAGVFALGLITLFASQYILPERLFPWLSLISGLMVVGIGLSLLVSRLRGVGVFGHTHDHDDHAHHDHPHHDHDHPPHTHSHSHQPPGSDGSPVTWRSLLGLGISGGLLPCPSALVVLLSAIALNRVAFGLLLVVAFSLGLAGVLTAIGLALVYARRFFDRVPTDSRLIRLVPAASALFILLAGVGITLQALAQMGVFRV